MKRVVLVFKKIIDSNIIKYNLNDQLSSIIKEIVEEKYAEETKEKKNIDILHFLIKESAEDFYVRHYRTLLNHITKNKFFYTLLAKMDLNKLELISSDYMELLHVVKTIYYYGRERRNKSACFIKPLEIEGEEKEKALKYIIRFIRNKEFLR